MIYCTVLIDKNLYFRDKSDIFAKEKTSKLTLMVQIGSFIQIICRQDEKTVEEIYWTINPKAEQE